MPTINERMHSLTRYPLLSEMAGGLEGWAVATFGTHLGAQTALASVDDARRHLWLAVWAQLTHRAEFVDQPENIELWRERLQAESFRRIARFAGFPDAVGLQRCFGRLGWKGLISTRAYIEVLDTLSEQGAAAKVLHHASTIDQRLVHLLPVFRDPSCTAELARAIAKNKRLKAEHARRILWRLRRLRDMSPEGAARVERILLAGKHALDPDLWARGSMPKPPWEGTPNLRPLSTAQAIKAAALEFRNCLDSRHSGVWSHETYFFQFEDIAIVEFESVGDIGWEAVRYLGPENSVVTPANRSRLQAELEKAPDHFCKALPNKPMWEH